MTSSAQDRFIGDDTRMLHRTTLHEENKKYVLWNADVGPIAEVLHERNCFPTQVLLKSDNRLWSYVQKRFSLAVHHQS